MRLIYTVNDQRKAESFSTFLKEQGIDNQLDSHKEKDWGNPDYGTSVYRTWVIDEDKVDEAQNFLKEFEENPQSVRFSTLAKGSKTERLRDLKIAVKPQPQKAKDGLGLVTLYFLVTCCLLLFITSTSNPVVTKVPANLPVAPLVTAPVEKMLKFDYPQAYEKVDALVIKYGMPALLDPAELPSEGQKLMAETAETPYWHGIYPKLVDKITGHAQAISLDTPMFEKIQQGEVWRLFTPALLHGGFIHLIFNILWLIVLGKQMEEKLGGLRYLLFILVTGIFANTMQYLMSGSNFIGFSGVICAMFTFIWFRQKQAPWEGYQLQPSTMGFIVIYIFVIFLIGLAGFGLEIYGYDARFATGIANTAHISGGIAGWFLAQFKSFEWKTTKNT